MKNKKKHFVFFTNLLAFSIVAPIAASFLLNLQNGSKSNFSNSISKQTNPSSSQEKMSIANKLSPSKNLYLVL